jgi:hypothetical protein
MFFFFSKGGEALLSSNFKHGLLKEVLRSDALSLFNIKIFVVGGEKGCWSTI